MQEFSRREKSKRRDERRNEVGKKNEKVSTGLR